MSDVEIMETLRRMERELSLLRAKDAIRDVLARYCRAIDRMDRELLLSCYHPDAVDMHGTYNGDREGFASYCMDQMLPVYFESTYYFTGTTLIDIIDDDHARCESYIFAPKELTEKTDDGVKQMWVGAARFLDRFERRNGEWRIAHRTLVNEWAFFAPTQTKAIGPFPYPPPDPAPVPKGKRDKSDLSYHF